MRILLVEDEKKLAAAVARALELQTYAVDVVGDGQHGYDMASSESYDLLILDVMLPKMNGVELTSKLRAEGTTTPILLLTAKGQVSDKTLGLDSGADDYMVKPFALEELFSRIRALVRRTQGSKSPILHTSDLSLDPIAITVKRGSQSIELSSKEFSILEYLLRHKNTVCSKEKIVNHVWNYDADILPATVEVHMKNLRDKIDRPFGSNLIHTVRGFGYEIKDQG
ncbi:response regulator transcription factor [Candidatus Woesebacteria bacterium]|nr:response regulator transcription factor [Candidatus Woesebacteria bacterium]